MKAAAIRRHGGPEVIEIEDLPDPEPAPGEALVELRAAQQRLEEGEQFGKIVLTGE